VKHASYLKRTLICIMGKSTDALYIDPNWKEQASESVEAGDILSEISVVVITFLKITTYLALKNIIINALSQKE